MLRLANQALTFDDVLLVPDYSEVLPQDVDLSTLLTKNISLKIPIVSAAMDTVTEARMAIALAEFGGIGIIHKNLSIKDQAQQVSSVKKFESGIVRDPITISSDKSIGELIQLTKDLNISGMPVVDEKHLVGIVTSRDYRNVSDISACVSTIMTPRERLVTAKENESLDQVKKLLYENRIEKIPLVDNSFSLQGLVTLKDINKTKDFPLASKDFEGRLLTGAAIGNGAETEDRLEALINAGVDIIVVDSAHGHSKGILERVASVKKTYPDIQVIAGNVATGEGAEALVKAGVDAVKVGIGPGSICTTRVVTGVGAMSGESNSGDRYFQENISQTDKLVPEGIEGRVPYKGFVETTLHQILGGLRQSMGYTGCTDIKTMKSKPKFMQITSSGIVESHVHDVSVTKEAPNYRMS
jgi:IMP dehydrogenase